MTSTLSAIFDQFGSSTPRPGLHPIPNSVPLTLPAALLPPLVYYAALLLLAPLPPPAVATAPVKTIRNILALIAAILFFRLPLAYYVPQSIGLTYQLGLVGIYGGCRVVDTFFISPYLFQHIPRRVRYKFEYRNESHPHLSSIEKEWSEGGVKDPFLIPDEPNGHVCISTKADDPGPQDQVVTSKLQTRRPSIVQQANGYLSKTIAGPDRRPVYETASTEEAWSSRLADRAAWALELELSMRGTGFTWTTADVRHTRKTWLPTVQSRLHSIFFRTLPVLLVCWTIIKSIYMGRLQAYENLSWQMRPTNLLDQALPLHEQLLLTAALGAFLMAAFSLGHSMFAVSLHPLSPSPLAFFPPLYTIRAWEVTSVRTFWSYGWHRLFARLFLVYGIWPGEWLERKLTGKAADQPADVGKVLGAFASSACVHAFSVRGVLAGDWMLAYGEARFFGLNGIAVLLEGFAVRTVTQLRRRNGGPEHMWYDTWIGRIWWMAVVLWTGRNFARGWITAHLVREMAFM